MSRETDLALIWKHTHSDFKGIAGQWNPDAWAPADRGKPMIMLMRSGGTCLVLLEDLTADEITERLPAARRREAQLH